MSFGESVMRTLQQAKKQEERVEPPTFQEEKPKLNLSKMNVNERKPEEKKNFNSLSMKLVKPPEKKPTEKKLETGVGSPQKGQQKPPGKPQGKVDIMDIDFLSGSPEPKQEQPVKYSSPSDPFDILSGPAPLPSNPVQQQQHMQQNPSNGLNFSLLAQTPNLLPQSQSPSLPAANQQPSNFLFTPNAPSPNYSYQQAPLQTSTTLQTSTNPFSFAQAPQSRPPPAQNISISLNAPPQVPSSPFSPNPMPVPRWT
jgi:hypothetical protein